MALPAPTEEWASIIGSLAWPLVIVFLVLRFRIFLRAFLEAIAERLPHDDLEFGAFKMSKHTRVVSLAEDDSDGSASEIHDQEKRRRIETLFEVLGTDDGAEALVRWIVENMPRDIDIEDFLTNDLYDNQRAQALAALGKEA